MGGGGGGELLVPWPEAMGLIIQLPSLRDGEGGGQVLGRLASFFCAPLPFPWLFRGTTQVGGGGGGELLVPWPEAMGLIIQLPSLPGWEG